jgi:lipopolysaccharide/colanic/teichoic acid biosynthesis glycosyltransferase
VTEKQLSPKRAFDLIVAGLAGVLTLPVAGVVAVAVRRSLGRPVLFRQTRIGMGSRPFELVKFRTMRPVDPARGWVDDESRMTRLGELLRATSLDELPSLWNIVRGDMSLVGPRPLLPQYLGRYSPEQARRHEVRPGLTGLAQRLRLDVEYVDTRSFLGDLVIIARTVGAVFRREGISAEGHVTMSEFMGPGTTEHDVSR